MYRKKEQEEINHNINNNANLAHLNPPILEIKTDSSFNISIQTL